MGNFVLSPRAEQDMKEIWRSIARENEPAADALIYRMFDKFELASGQPRMGAARPELSHSARILIEGNYIAIYEPKPDGIFIVAVVYSKRNPENWL